MKTETGLNLTVSQQLEQLVICCEELENGDPERAALSKKLAETIMSVREQFVKGEISVHEFIMEIGNVKDILNKLAKS